MSFLRLDGSEARVTAIKIVNKRKITVDTRGNQVFAAKDIENAKKHIGASMFSMVDGSPAVCVYMYRTTCYDEFGNKVYPTKAKALRRKQIELATEERRKRKAAGGAKPPKKKRKTVEEPIQVVVTQHTYTSVAEIMADMYTKKITPAEARAYIVQTPALLENLPPVIRCEHIFWCRAHGCVFNA